MLLQFTKMNLNVYKGVYTPDFE